MQKVHGSGMLLSVLSDIIKLNRSYVTSIGVYGCYKTHAGVTHELKRSQLTKTFLRESYSDRLFLRVPAASFQNTAAEANWWGWRTDKF